MRVNYKEFNLPVGEKLLDVVSMREPLSTEVVNSRAPSGGE
jgi:hypothetical protein